MFTKKQILALVVCCLMIASSVGLLTNTSGVFFTPISSELGVGKGAVSMTLTISNIAYAFGGLLTVKLIRERNFKRMVLIFSSVYAICTGLLSVCNSVFLLYLLNAIRGLSTGIVGIVLVTILINNHFDNGVGLATSIALGFSGLAGAILSPLLSSIIAIVGWRITYVIEAVLAFLCYLPCIVLPIALNNKIKDCNDTNVQQAVSTKTVACTTFLVVAIYSFMIASGTALPQHFPSMTVNASTGALMVSVSMVMNTTGKLVLGVASDKLGIEKSLLVYGILTLSGLGVLAFFSSSAIWMLIAAGLVGMVYAMSAVGPVLLSQKLFQESYNLYYPKISLLGTVSNALFTTFVGFLYDLSGSYHSSILLVMVLTVIALFMVVYSLKMKNKSDALI